MNNMNLIKYNVILGEKGVMYSPMLINTGAGIIETDWYKRKPNPKYKKILKDIIDKIDSNREKYFPNLEEIFKKSSYDEDYNKINEVYELYTFKDYDAIYDCEMELSVYIEMEKILYKPNYDNQKVSDSQLKDCELLAKYGQSGYNKLIVTDWGYIVKLAVYDYGFVKINFNKNQREQMIKVFTGNFELPVSITKDGKNFNYNPNSSIIFYAHNYTTSASCSGLWDIGYKRTLYKYSRNHGVNYVVKDENYEYIIRGRNPIEKFKIKKIG